MMAIPVVTIDGPSSSGKGTIGQIIARQLHWHYLDSGALYRALALAALRKHIALEDESHLADLAAALPIEFIDDGKNYTLRLESEDITDAIRTEACSKAASFVAALPQVRQGLLARQRAFQKAPGLVTDGRDMGTIVFPGANFKFFLEASVAERAERRYGQLLALGIPVKLDDIFSELQLRDERDRNRAIAPLIPAQDAHVIDTTGMAINEVTAVVRDVLPRAWFSG